jgi:hypothetical protein
MKSSLSILTIYWIVQQRRLVAQRVSACYQFMGDRLGGQITSDE